MTQVFAGDHFNYELELSGPWLSY